MHYINNNNKNIAHDWHKDLSWYICSADNSINYENNVFKLFTQCFRPVSRFSSPLEMTIEIVTIDTVGNKAHHMRRMTVCLSHNSSTDAYIRIWLRYHTNCIWVNKNTLEYCNDRKKTSWGLREIRYLRYRVVEGKYARPGRNDDYIIKKLDTLLNCLDQREATVPNWKC